MKKRKRQDLSQVKEIVKDRKILIYLVTLAVILLIVSASTLILPSFAAKLIDWYFMYGELNNGFLIILLFGALLSSVMSFFEKFFSYILSERFALIARNKLFSQIVHQPENYFLKTKKSKLLTVIMSDINFVKQILTQFVSLSVTSVLMILGSAIFMLLINVRLALIIIIFVPLALLTSMYIIRNIKKLFVSVQKERDNFNRVIDENVKASMLVRVFTSEDEETKKFKKTNEETLRIQKEIIKKISVMMPIVFFVSFTGSLFIVYFGGNSVIDGTMTLGEIAAFNNYISMFITPIMMIGMIANMIGQAFASLDRINSVLKDRNDFSDGSLLCDNIKTVKAKKLNLYIGAKHVLKNIDFEIKRGEKVGVIGLTGSGKSMLIQLLLRLIEPSSGKILLNGRSISDYEVSTLREKMGVVFQDNFLIDDTIDNNIDFKRGILHDDIKLSRKVALVDEFYQNNSPRYKIGELGRKLSGGQKQRLRIARAVASRPDLLILDDCTSNLDVKTEDSILRNIRSKLEEVGIVIISQKISSLVKCDRIYVMGDGMIEAVGTHEELLKESLTYKEIEMTQKNRSEK